MKKILSVLLLATLLVSLSACKSKCEVHRFDTKHNQVKEDATCTTDGYGKRKCAKCGFKEEYVIPKLDHKFEKISSTQTCTEPGVESYKCTRCDYTFESQKEAMGHTWVPATCLMPKQCSVCGLTEGETSAHNFDGASCTICKAENIKTVSCNGVNFIVFNEAKVKCSLGEIKISDISITFDAVYGSYSRFTVNYSAECLRGNNTGISFCYTLYDADGYVVSSGDAYTTNLKTGEKTRNQYFTLELPHVSGDLQRGKTYKLVLSDN